MDEIKCPIMTTRKFWEELNKIIELPPNGVKKVVITAVHNEIVKIDLTMNGHYAETHAPIVKRFTLKEIEDGGEEG